MKCVVCKGGDIVERQVEEEIKLGNDVVFIPLKLMVCEECGERYYSRAIMKKLEGIEKHIKEKKSSFKEIGRVLKLVET